MAAEKLINNNRDNSLPMALTILGRRGHVIAQAFQAISLHCSFQKKISGPRRIFGVLYESLFQLARNFRGYDLVLTDGIEYVPLAWVISKILKKPLVIRVRGDCWAEFAQKEKIGEFAVPGARFLLKFYTWVLRNCSAVVPVSRYLKERIVANTRVDKKVLFTIPTSVKTDGYLRIDRNVARKALGFEGKRIIITVTNFRFPDKVNMLEKYLPGLINLLKEVPESVFLIAGAGGYLKPFKAKVASSLGLVSERVIFLGYVKDMGLLYSAAVLVVYFSGLDAFPRVILEAQTSERPVIANPVGGIPEMIRHGVTGYIVNSNDEFHKIAKMLIDNRELQERIGKQARISVKQEYSPVVVGLKWRRVLRKILKQKNHVYK